MLHPPQVYWLWDVISADRACEYHQEARRRSTHLASLVASM